MKKTLIALLMIPTMAAAEFKTGNQLLANIQADSPIENAVALGYIMGISDITRGAGHCAPAEATAGQMRDMVKNHLIAYPQYRHTTADIIVTAVLGVAWPCKPTSNKPKEKNT